MSRTMISGGSKIPASQLGMPGRPGVIIRPPDRESSNANKQVVGTLGSSNSSTVLQGDFTVYVNSQQCKHSNELLHDMSRVYKIEGEIIDICNTPRVPSWLPGTPSIVHGENVYCGNSAFSFLESFVHQQSQPTKPQPESVQAMINGNASKASDTKGCGLQQAFSKPVESSEEDLNQRYAQSTDQMMAKMMELRK